MKPARMHDGSVLQGQLALSGRLDARFFVLLQALADSGSLQKAARVAGYSYKGAWLVLETAGNLASTPLLTRMQGGRGGGGSTLTTAGAQLLAAWHTLHARHTSFLREQEAWLAQHLNDNPALAGLMRRLSMKTTARNQFAGTIRSLERGPATVHVTLALPGGLSIMASITAAAAQSMKLKKGQEAVALIKASEVVLVTDFAGWRLSARNQLDGTIARIVKGGVTSLVGLTLPGGATITATVTNDAVDALGLSVGQPATATFKAYAVMLAVQ